MGGARRCSRCAVGGCGGDDGASAEDAAEGLAVPWVDPDGDPPIVGSLTVNPADSTLFMATNTGLFRIPDGASKPEKITGTLKTPDGTGRSRSRSWCASAGPTSCSAPATRRRARRCRPRSG